jgi:hypothetical protein
VEAVAQRYERILPVLVVLAAAVLVAQQVLELMEL